MLNAKDEIIVELPENDNLTKEVDNICKIMVDSMKETLKKTKCRVEPAVMRTWYKEAEEFRDHEGNILVWTPELAAQKAREAALKQELAEEKEKELKIEISEDGELLDDEPESESSLNILEADEELPEEEATEDCSPLVISEEPKIKITRTVKEVTEEFVGF